MRTTPESPGATRTSTNSPFAFSSTPTRSAISNASWVAVSARSKPNRDVTVTVGLEVAARREGASSPEKDCACVVSCFSGGGAVRSSPTVPARDSRSRLRIPQNRATATCVSRSPPSPPGDGRRNIVVGGASASTAAASACTSDAAENSASSNEAAAVASSAPTPSPELMPKRKPPTPRSLSPAPRVVCPARPRRPGDAAAFLGVVSEKLSGRHFAFELGFVVVSFRSPSHHPIIRERASDGRGARAQAPAGACVRQACGARWWPRRGSRAVPGDRC